MTNQISSNQEIELSVIILCYRAEESIIDFANRTSLLASKISDNYEIVLVGNYIEGSNDRTKDVVTKLAAENPRYRAICKPKQGMMGWDMKEGLNFARGQYLCVIDGDGQFPLESIELCFNKIKNSNYQLVKTYRTTRNDGLYRKTISMVYNLLFSILFPGLNSRDVNSKPKIMTRSAYEAMTLNSEDWFIDAEIMLNIRKLKLPFYEFPVEFLELEGRASFVKFKAIFEFIRNLLVYRIKN